MIEIEAQEQVVGLYEKFGFVTQGAPFIFESRPHIKMIYNKWKNPVDEPLLVTVFQLDFAFLKHAVFIG